MIALRLIVRGLVRKRVVQDGMGPVHLANSSGAKAPYGFESRPAIIIGIRLV